MSFYKDIRLLDLLRCLPSCGLSKFMIFIHPSTSQQIILIGHEVNPISSIFPHGSKPFTSEWAVFERGTSSTAESPVSKAQSSLYHVRPFSKTSQALRILLVRHPQLHTRVLLAVREESRGRVRRCFGGNAGGPSVLRLYSDELFLWCWS
jgi:hypothetical protein